jgi:HK97 family phage major capsid protein
MNNAEKRAQLIARANELLSKKPYTKEDSSLFDSYMKLADALNDAPVTTPEDRNAEASKSFRSYLGTGEKRTYAGLSVSVDGSGGYLVPNTFYGKVTSMLAATDVLFDPNVVTVFEDEHGNAMKAPVLTDEGKSASIVGENTDGTENELSFSGLTLGKIDTWRSGKFVFRRSLRKTARSLLARCSRQRKA